MNVTADVFGLPAHPLLVHGVLVLLPLAVVALVLTQFWPAARARLGAVTPAAALVVAVLVPFTVSAGESLKELVGPLPAVLEHERYGRMLWPWSLGLFVIATAQWFWFRRAESMRGERTTTVVRVGLGAAVVGVAAGSLTVLVLTGHSGSRAVWGSLVGG